MNIPMVADRVLSCCWRTGSRVLVAGALAGVCVAALAQTRKVAPDHPTYLPGEPITIAFENGPGNKKDWIGVYAAGVEPGGPPSLVWFYVDGTQAGNVGLTSGSVTFPNGLSLAGDYMVYLLLNDGWEKLAEAGFSIVEPYSPLVRADKKVYAPAEAISVTFSNGPANAKDWVGIYPAGVLPGGPPSLLWWYVDGTQTGRTGLDSGTLVFPTGLPNPGDYTVYFLQNDGYDILSSDTFAVRAAQAKPVVIATEPVNNATDAPPLPNYSATVRNGTTSLVPGTVSLSFDGTVVAHQLTQEGNEARVTYASDTLLAGGSVHTFTLAFADNATPPNQITHTVTFTVVAYTSITLPPPLFFENFDGTPEGELPSGWSQISYTDIQNPEVDFGNLDSAAYATWTVVNVERFRGDFITYSNPDTPQNEREDYRRVLTPNPRYVVNGKLVTSFAEGRFLFGDSGYRLGLSQVLYAFTPDYDLSGKSDIHVVFHSLWEQNQDSIAAIEYSVDRGATWLPIAYFLDGPDIMRDQSNAIDAVATFTTEAADIADYLDPDTGEEKGGSYGAFIAASIGPDLAPFIQARVNDDPSESKRVEMCRLTAADNQAAVRFRFAHAGTDSWYFGIDNFGLYSVPQVSAPGISSQPQSISVFQSDRAVLSVKASGVGPFTYQWFHNGVKVEGATKADYTIENAQALDAGVYRVEVSNQVGATPSDDATVTVSPLPGVVAGSWSFDSSSLAISTGVGTLEYADGEATATQTQFFVTDGTTVPHIGGQPAHYMFAPAFQDQANGYALTMPTQPVGAEGWINRYTVIWDLLLPGTPAWTALFNTSPGNANDADFYVGERGALGIGALGYSPDNTIEPDRWYRVVFAANLSAGRATYYIDGQAVATRTGDSLADGRFALYSDRDAGPDVRLFNEGDGSGVYTHDILLNNFAFISRELSAAEIATLGGPTAVPINLPLVEEQVVLGAATVSGSMISFGWTGGTPPFQVEKKSSLSDASWQSVGGITLQRSFSEPITGPAAFYRVIRIVPP